VFHASPGYAGEPPTPPLPAGFDVVASDGDWTLATSCELTPAAARSGP
jgi:hypothetical protein